MLLPNRFRVEKFLYNLFSTNTTLMPKIGNTLRLYREVAPPEPPFPYFVYGLRVDSHGPEDFFVEGALALSIYTLVVNGRYGQNEAIQQSVDDLLNSKFYRHAEGTDEALQISFYLDDDRSVNTDHQDIERADLIYYFKMNTRYQPPEI